MRPLAFVLLVTLFAGGAAEARSKKLAHKKHTHDVVQTQVQGPVPVATAQPPADGSMLTGVDAGRPVVVSAKPGVFAVPLELRTAIAAPLIAGPVVAPPMYLRMPPAAVQLSQYVTGYPVAFVR